MTNINSFLKKKNIEISARRYFLEAFSSMTLGLFSSLLIGLIIKTIASKFGISWLTTVGAQAMNMTGAAIGVSVAYALKSPPLVLFSSTVSGAIGYATGGPAGCFIAVIFGAECGKLISKETRLDIMLTPTITICVGALVASLLGPAINNLMIGIGSSITWATEMKPILMGMFIAVIMGLCLTAPISSAAIAIMLNLHGLAAGAATVGCCCQMIGFATISYRDNKFGAVIAQALGTSMLQVPNIIKNPRILLPPIIASLILGPIATTLLPMKNIPIGAGMGTSGFVGQFGTYTAMTATGETGFIILLKISLLHFILPALICFVIIQYLRKKNLVHNDDTKLDI